MEEACIIHTDSEKEEYHLETVAMLEAKRSRSQKDNRSRNRDKKMKERVVMNLQARQLLGQGNRRGRGIPIL